MGGIVWIASYPKSGNTWTRSFLHNLLRPQDETHDINDMQDLTAYEIGVRWFAPLLAKPLELCTEEEVAAVRPRAQEALAAEAPGLVFVKTHNALAVEFGHPVINTKVTAGAVYIVRDPRDVAPSFAHHLSTDLNTAIARMNADNLTVPNTKETAYELYGSWRQNVDSWTLKPHQSKHVMRYEDMLAKPERTFRDLCDFLLLAPTRKALLDAIEKSSFARLKELEEKRGFSEKPAAAPSFFREGKAGTWREHLSHAQIAAIEDVNREQMARCGYAPAGARAPRRPLHRLR